MEVTPLPKTVTTTVPANTTKDISVVFNGTKVTFPDHQPINKAGSVLVPVYAIIEALGGNVTWDEQKKTVSIVINDDSTVVLTIGSKIATVNGKVIALNIPAAIINSRTVVPIRFVSEGMGLTVDWDKASSTVSISDK